MNKSFSAEVKEHITSQKIRKKCCAHALSDGETIFDGDDHAKSIMRGYNGLVCRDCLSYFVAGLFVAAGSVTDPAKGYHLDCAFPDKQSADVAKEVLAAAGFEAGSTERAGREILYFKSSTAIEDLLGYIGAATASFRVMDSKIMREMRENTNRQVNCDSANIAKILSASEEQIRIIDELKERGFFDLLTGDLKETANLRVRYPDDSMSELGRRFVPPISKSGVKHRLDKIADFYRSKLSETT